MGGGGWYYVLQKGDLIYHIGEEKDTKLYIWMSSF